MKDIRTVDPKLFLYLSLAGMVLVAAGITAYVLEPGPFKQAVFVIGVLILISNYTLLYLSNSRTCSELKVLQDKADEGGFFYVLDEDYTPFVGDATIIDLTKE